MNKGKLVFENWKYPEVDGMPEDGDLCIVMWEFCQGELDVFVGGYHPEHKQFYQNWGLGGAILEEEYIVCWKLLDDYKWECEV